MSLRRRKRSGRGLPCLGHMECRLSVVVVGGGGGFGEVRCRGEGSGVEGVDDVKWIDGWSLVWVEIGSGGEEDGVCLSV